jgi:hypothetical protein
MSSQVIDTPTAEELLGEIMQRATVDELDGIVSALSTKSQRFADLLGPERIGDLDEDGLHKIFRSIFGARKRVDQLVLRTGPAEMAKAVTELLYGSGPVASRLEAFAELIPPIRPGLPVEIGTELLHFADPEQYWLWTRWMWDPAAETGSLRLMTMDDFPLDGDTIGQSYLRIGEAQAVIAETGQMIGFGPMAAGLLGLDVFLAGAYSVYMYTVLQMRLSKEFNQIVPPLPELVRRLLGVHRLEV